MIENPTKIQPLLMNIKETAEFLKISRASVYRLIQEKGLPVYRLGGSVRTKPDEVEKWLVSQKAE